MAKLRSVLALVPFWLLACADEPEQSLDLAVIAGCESEAYSECNVLEADCQARIFQTVSCLRGMSEAPRPEVRVITRDEYEAELRAPPPETAEPTDTVPEPSTEAPPPVADLENDVRVEHALELLGLAQPADFSEESFVELYSESVPGYYSNTDKRVTLIDQGAASGRSAGGDTLLLAHEYVHALQDEQVGLGNLQAQAQTFDKFLATLGVIEGEASMFESFFGAAMWQLEGDIDFSSHYTSWLPEAEERYAGQSPLLVGPRYFPYSYGASYVYGVYLEGGVAAVRDTFTNLPQSVLSMLPGDRALREAVIEPLDALAAPVAPLDFELVTQDTLGPWVFGKFLQRSLSEYAFEQLTSHWRGDRFFVYSNGNGVVTGVWAIQLDAAPAAEQLTAMLDGGGNVNLSPSAFRVRAGRNVAVAVTDDPSSTDMWTSNIAVAQQNAESEPGSSSSAGAPRLSAALRRRLVRHLD